MKIKNLFLSGLVCCSLAACSNNDDVSVDNGEETMGDQFMVVNIATSGTNSRAESNNYEDGSDTENNIQNGLFVFFDASGNYITASPVTSFTPIENSSTTTSPLIEKKYEAVIVLDEPNSVPASMITILNSNLTKSDIEALSSKTQTSVSQMIINCAQTTISTDAENNNEGKFIMSNSVWKDNLATPITSDHLNKKETKGENPTEDQIKAAKAVDVYVERVLARVDVQKGNNFTINVSQTTTGEEGSATTTKSNKIKIREKGTNGWEYKEYEFSSELKNVHLSYTSPVSYIVKKLPTDIDNQWNYQTEAWDDAPNKRSYWAESVPVSSFGNSNNWGYVKYSDGAAFGEANEVQMYCQENTTSYTATDDYAADNTATKLVITAQHKVKEASTNKEVNLYKYKTQYYFEDGIKAEICELLSGYYYAVTENEKTIYTNDWSEKFNLVRATGDDVKKYYIEPQFITSLGIDKIYTDNEGKSEVSLGTEGTVSSYLTTNVLDKVESIWCWQSGKAYYYVDIDHINGKPAIIRNHIYQLTLNSIVGLGTPIFDPDTNSDGTPDEEEIIPEKPTDDAFFVTAQINVLKWRLVANQDVTLEW